MIARIVVLALGDAEMVSAVREQLAPFGAIFEVVEPSRLWSWLEHEACDLVVIDGPAAGSMQRMLERLPRLAQRAEPPAVVVIADSVGIEQRADLLAAGCTAVVERALSVSRLVALLRRYMEQQSDRVQKRLDVPRLREQPALSDFFSRSPVMRDFMHTVQRVIGADVPLLILGETGVGKERLARAIHNASRRASGPFIAVNCAALPETLLESELFGHVEGAFTGARARRGCFELAHSGTVFLDEIGEMPHHLQVKLLRVLQDHKVRRLGGERQIDIDVRVMAATNRQLDVPAPEDKPFRSDLYYRLTVMTLTIPPLRERREDIPQLAASHLELLRPRVGREVRQMSDEALEALTRYSWPGNVRELINVIERAMLLCGSDTIHVYDLPEAIGRLGGAGVALIDAGVAQRPMFELRDDWLERPLRDVRDELVIWFERSYLREQLAATGGRVGEAARRAGLDPRSLYDKMRRYGLRKEDFRG